jgi:hypothetical protein
MAAQVGSADQSLHLVAGFHMSSVMINEPVELSNSNQEGKHNPVPKAPVGDPSGQQLLWVELPCWPALQQQRSHLQ